jgi:hypothetical protein
MHNTTVEMIFIAEDEAFIMPEQEEPERADLAPRDAHLEAIEQREELISALQYVVVSDEVRAICGREMEEGRKSGWRINQ